MKIDVPPILRPNSGLLQEFFEGMLFKLAVNAFKDETVAKDIPILIDRLIDELEEMKDEIEGDNITPNALVETFDMGNFCFLLYQYMRRNGVPDEREEFLRENFVVEALTGKVIAIKNRSGSRYRKGDEVTGSYRKGRCYIRVQHALSGASVSMPRDHIVWWFGHKRWPNGELRHIDSDPGNDALNNLVEIPDNEERSFPFVVKWAPRGKENHKHYGMFRYQRRHKGVLVVADGYWPTQEDAAREGLKQWKEKTRV